MSGVLRAVIAAAIVLVAAAGYYLATRTRSVAPPRRAVVIRHPTPVKHRLVMKRTEPLRGAQNIAPFATVTVSSVRAGGSGAEGVADGERDLNEWVSEGEMSGAWIKLVWDKPATITEIVLYDRPDPAENILGGVLEFEDGSQIPVPALPPGGDPWRVTFAPKTVRWVVLRIESVQGRNAGLVEFAVYGDLSR
mgnify:CR=1 FL=1